MLKTKQRARIVLGIFVTAVFIQAVRVAPAMEYMLGAFPTHFHKVEWIILALLLFSSLTVVSFVSGRITLVALTILSALMFYSGFKAIVTISAELPVDARVIWISVSVSMAGLLAWVVSAAFRKSFFWWWGVLNSFLIAGLGVVYLQTIHMF